MDPRIDLDDVEKRKFWTLPGLELRLLCSPGRSQSIPTTLFWLRRSLYTVIKYGIMLNSLWQLTIEKNNEIAL
jgi:hypothetical protein